MSGSSFKLDDMKRKVRRLKKLEIRIRFQNDSVKAEKIGLVWEEFFGEKMGKEGKYSMEALSVMNKDEYKRIVSEYFFHVYYRQYRENGTVFENIYDPELLSELGLPYDSDSITIKKRFRELAKLYHPDCGGDSLLFIDLMDKYENFINNS